MPVAGRHAIRLVGWLPNLPTASRLGRCIHVELWNAAGLRVISEGRRASRCSGRPAHGRPAMGLHQRQLARADARSTCCHIRLVI